MPLPEPSDDANWFRWLVGGAVSILLAAFAHIYSKIESLRRDTEEQSDRQVKRIETQLEKLREELAEDRKEVARSQNEIARTMVTQDKLDRQIDRIVRALSGGGGGNRSGGYYPKGEE